MKKKTLRRVNKGLNAFVAILLLLQPVGTPGILGAYLALGQTATDAQPASSDSGQTDSTSADQPKDSGSSDASTTTNDNSGSTTDTSTSGSATETTNTSSNEPSTPPSGADAGTEATNPVDTSTPADASQSDPTSTAPSDTPAPDDTSSTAPATDTNSTAADSGTISPDAAAADAPATEASGKICLADGANIVSSDKSDWDVSGDTAETKNKVELGVKYVFPGNDKVSVTFTCLPAASADRTTLKIEQINSADINLPDGIAPASEYAYDITTGMKDGDFKYDLTLPKAIFDDAELKYIEKSASEVTKNDLSKSDLKSISDSQLKEQKNSIEVENLDHLTIFVPTISMGVLNSLINSGCNVDSAGANDEPGQKDLTKMCADYGNLPSSIDILWNWDDTGWSGNNSGDACSLFDTDGDGLVNYSLCTIVKHDPAQYDSKVLYLCGDNAINKCTNPISTISPSTGTICDASVKDEDPFSAGNDYPDDTVAECTINLSDVGGSVAELIDVCSYPSQQPNSDPSDCVIFKTSSGKLQVDKILIPSGDSGKFNLQVDGTTLATDVGNNGSTSVQVVDVGNHTVGETAGTNTNLSSYNSSIVCKDLHGSGSIVAQSSNSGPLDVDVQDGDDIVCTITNSLNQATLTVNKVIVNDNGGTATVADFQAKIDGNNVPWATPQSLLPDSYTVSEDAFSGYVASIGGDCDSNGNVTLAAGESKTCIITNDDQPATLIVKKIVVNDNGGSLEADDFSFQANGGSATAFEADGQNDLTVSAGTYNITEPAIAGYTTTYNNCSGVVIPNGGSATCTITNDDIAPKLKLVKTVINDNGGNATANDFQAYINSNAVSWDVFNTLDAGNYTASESNLSGYTPSAWGGDCAIDGSITLNPGDEKTCTITNDDQPGTLIVKKIVVNDDGGNKTCPEFSFSYNSSGNIAFESDCQNDITVPAGTYNVTEPAVTGYATTYDNCSNVVIPNGGSATCTITNDDIAPKLTLVKHVTNNNGGNAVVSDFPLFIDGTPAISETAYEVTANTIHTATETNLPGYTPSSWSGDCAADGTVILLPGEEKTCEITNDDVSASIILIKNVINNNGGNAGVDDFGLTIGGTAVTSGQKLNVDANTTYALNETVITGYDFVSMTGDTKCPSVLGGTATLDEGENITCTITNDDQSPTITLVKNVINNNGGTAGANDFGLTIGGTAVDSGQTLNVLANTSYALNEAGLFGYEFVSLTGDTKCPSVLGGSVSLDEGEDVTCTITNNDIQPKLTVYKFVDNSDGGNLLPSDFSISVSGTNVNPSDFAGSSSGTQVVLDAGVYEVTETEISGYEAKYSVDCDGSIAVGETKTCTITNDDEAPTLTLVKTVVNDNGGDKEVSDFNLYISGNPVTSDVPVTLKANTQYTASEDQLTGYTASVWSGDCSPSGNVTLAPGQDAVCYITNDDIAPKLTLIKHVVTDNGGTAVVSDFPLFIDGTPAISETAYEVAANALHTATETNQPGYTPSSWGGDCAAGGTITLLPGDNKTCEITNDDQSGRLIVEKIVVNDNNGGKVASDFSFSVNGGGAQSFEVDGQNEMTVNSGYYSVTEPAVTGYATSYDNCTSIFVPNGGSATCTITNDDIKPKLKVIKHVINDNNGTAVASDFTIGVAGNAANPWQFQGSETGTNISIDAGDYIVDEAPLTGYAKSLSADCTGKLLPGDDKTCTITNNDIQPKLTVTKVVVNDGYGTLVISDFPLYVDTTSVTSGVQNNFNVGDYVVSETNQPGYAAEITGDCDEEGNVTLNPGDVKACTITNNDEFGKIIVEKQTFPDGDSQKFDFTGDVSGQAADDGQIYAIVVPGTYTSTENDPTPAFDLTDITCDDGGDSSGDLASRTATFNVQPSETVKCTFTNTKRGSIDIIKTAIGPDGGNTNFGFDTSWTTPANFTLKGGYHRQDFNLQPEAYSVTETSTQGWDLTDLSCVSDQAGFANTGTSPTAAFNLRPGENVACTFTNTERGSISGMKFDDINGDGTKDTGDGGLSGWTIFIDENDNQAPDAGEISATTLAGGTYQFPNLIPGTYSVCEVDQNDWQRTYPVASNCQDVTVNPGNTTNNVNFGNFELGEITACKYNDLNGNGIYESPDDQPIPGISIKLSKNISASWVLQDTKDTETNGCTSFSGLTAGQYRVEEDYADPDLTGYYSSDGKTYHDVSVVSGTNETRMFLNTLYRTISGTKFNDLNGNGVKDTGEPGLQDWTIFIDYNNNDFLDAGEPSVKTDVNGNYEFANLAADSYTIAEILEPGWTQTAPAAGHYGVDVHTAITSTGNDFGNFQNVSVKACKLADADADAATTGDQFPVYGWTMNLLIDGNVSDIQTTGEDGCYTWADLGPSHNYGVSEETRTDWMPLTPTSYDFGAAASGSQYEYTFINTQLGNITITKFNDEDSDGYMGSEAALPDWGINLAPVPGSPTTQNTDVNGQTTFVNLVPGDYNLSENVQPGWVLTNIYCNFDREENGDFVQALQLLINNNNSYDFSVYPGENLQCFIGNHFTPPSLQIQKSNNKFPVDQAPGSDVVYTLTVTALDNDVNGVEVIDLPPAGFTYRSGSWTASSSVRGDIKNNPTTEPTYHSPGIWNLGDMKQDEVVTLTYVADISTDQESGSYPDLAWTSGKSLLSQDVLGAGTSSHFVQDAFVGTEVAVVRTGIVKAASVKIETDTDTEHKSRKIVILPATGFSPWWIAVAILILLAGAGFMYAGKRKKKEDNPDDTNNMDTIAKLLVAGLVGLSVLFGAKAVRAADADIAARMMTPKSPYQLTDFNLGFVALDRNDNSITVQCFFDGSTTPFDEISLAPGGTSGNCHVTSAVIPGDGTYNFRIVAKSASGTAGSTPVLLEVILGGPGTPTNYSRTKVSECELNIKAITADDGGKTVRVEIYRSTERSYTADASTLVTSLDVGSNQPVSYVDTKPVCGDTFYYAMRAFDALGNGSGIVADERTVVRTTGGGTTTITAPGGGAIPTGGAVAGTTAGGATTGEVAGEQTPTEEQAGPAEGEEGQVLGEETAAEEPQSFIEKHKALSAIIALAILAIIYYAFIKTKKTKLPGPPQKPGGPEAEA